MQVEASLTIWPDDIIKMHLLYCIPDFVVTSALLFQLVIYQEICFVTFFYMAVTLSGDQQPAISNREDE